MHHNAKGSNCPLYRLSLSVSVFIPERYFHSFRQALQNSSPPLSFYFLSLVHIYRVRIVNRTPIPMSSLTLTMIPIDNPSHSINFYQSTYSLFFSERDNSILFLCIRFLNTSYLLDSLSSSSSSHTQQTKICTDVASGK